MAPCTSFHVLIRCDSKAKAAHSGRRRTRKRRRRCQQWQQPRAAKCLLSRSVPISHCDCILIFPRATCRSLILSPTHPTHRWLSSECLMLCAAGWGCSNRELLSRMRWKCSTRRRAYPHLRWRPLRRRCACYARQPMCCANIVSTASAGGTTAEPTTREEPAPGASYCGEGMSSHLLSPGKLMAQ